MLNRTRTIASLLAAGTLAFIGCQSADNGADNSAVQRSAHDRYIVKFSNAASARSALAGAGATLKRDLPSMNAAAYHIPARALDALAANPHIQYIEVDHPRAPKAEVVPYGITMVQADQLSDANAAAVKVCIIDSGYNSGHEDLPGLTGADVTPDSGSGDVFDDTCGHGTHVAGTIAALGNNGVGVVGVNPSGNIALHIIKVFGDNTDPCAWSYSSDLVFAAEQCRLAGANVVSMSLGCAGGPGGGPFACASRTEEAKFDQLEAEGILSVAAASNDGTSDLSYPASYGSVMSVAALDINKQHASFSNTNSAVEIAAPGVAVLSTLPMNTAAKASVDVGGAAVDAAGMDGSPFKKATGALVDCGDGQSTCAGASGAVCLIERGTIAFSDKVLACEAGGGVAAIIYNNEPGMLFGTLGGVTTTIPSVGISQADGQDLVANSLGASTTVDVARDHYAAWDGTSMATPHVAGVAALVWSQNPSWTAAQIREALTATAEDLGAPGRDVEYGYGLVQAKAAFDYLNNGPPVCNPTEANETSCNDGVDNDCDGATDGADSDCAPTCTPTETTEVSCSDGVDNDCDGDTDAADSDCAGGPTCELAQLGDSCEFDSDCCSSKCKGRTGFKTCK